VAYRKKKQNWDLTILQILLEIPFILVSKTCQKKASNPTFCDVWYDYMCNNKSVYAVTGHKGQ